MFREHFLPQELFWFVYCFVLLFFASSVQLVLKLVLESPAAQQRAAPVPAGSGDAPSRALIASTPRRSPVPPSQARGLRCLRGTGRAGPGRGAALLLPGHSAEQGGDRAPLPSLHSSRGATSGAAPPSCPAGGSAPSGRPQGGAAAGSPQGPARAAPGGRHRSQRS